MRNFLLMSIAALTLGGCATLPEMETREDFLREVSRTYPGETTERVIKAAEIVVRSTGAPKLDFRHDLNGFTAFRQYFLYLVVTATMGRDKWVFSATNKAGGIVASVQVSDEAQVINSTGTTSAESGLKYAPVYRLFWKRMDYVLGRSTTWPTCEAERKQLEAQRIYWDYLNSMCPERDETRPPEQLARLR